MSYDEIMSMIRLLPFYLRDRSRPHNKLFPIILVMFLWGVNGALYAMGVVLEPIWWLAVIVTAIPVIWWLFKRALPYARRYIREYRKIRATRKYHEESRMTHN